MTGGGNRCQGCKVKVKKHKFGKCGPTCNGPSGAGGSDDEKSSDFSEQLRIITERLMSLEAGTGATPKVQKKPVVLSSDEDEMDPESMTKEQMVDFIKNAKKNRDELKKVATSDIPVDKSKRRVGFESSEASNRDRRLSLSNLFDTEYHRDEEQLGLQKAADRLKEKQRTKDKNSDNRIPGVGCIDDLRLDPRLVNPTEDFLRETASRAPWLQSSAERAAG